MIFLVYGGECKGKEDPNNIRGNEHREDVVAEFINKSDMFAVDLLNCMPDLLG